MRFGLGIFDYDYCPDLRDSAQFERWQIMDLITPVIGFGWLFAMVAMVVVANRSRGCCRCNDSDIFRIFLGKDYCRDCWLDYENECR